MFLLRGRNKASGASDGARNGHLQAIRFHDGGKLELLDQRKLPLETKYIEIKDVKAGWKAIHDMAVRGAPAIAISAALSLAADLLHGGAGKQFASASEAADTVRSKFDYLVTSRPTAVNLSIAATEIKALAKEAAVGEAATPQSVVEEVVAAAKKMLEDDLAQNKAIGEHGAAALLGAVEEARRAAVADGLRVLTICNTGSLATAGYGTALGVIRSLHAQGKLKRAYACETRPYNQGSRLTAYELVYEGMPASLICDSAAPSLMAKGEVDAIVVGADRITVNGDTANKIGTSMLAVAAAHYGVPFFVAATLSTVDPNMPDGSGIPIEERSPTEVTHSLGRRVAAEGIEVWNPAFDVTSAALIHGIITEKGCYTAKGAYDMVAFKDGKASGAAAPHAAAATTAPPPPPAKSEATPAVAAPAEAAATPPLSPEPLPEAGDGTIRPVGEALTEETVVAYILARPELAARIGAAATSGDWKVKEVGDGNINFVYIVEGPDGALCIKQALPFVRCVGESWPLTQDRLKFEAQAMLLEAKLCPAHVPAIYEYNPKDSVMVMQYLPPPHVILRHSMNQGAIYPQLAAHCAEFLATTLFRSSFLAVPAEEFRKNVAASTNTAMCALTEQVIFEEPLFDAANNSYLKPHMQEAVKELWADAAAKTTITQMKELFISKAEALLHGDVHTGSIMVHPPAYLPACRLTPPSTWGHKTCLPSLPSSPACQLAPPSIWGHKARLPSLPSPPACHPYPPACQLAPAMLGPQGPPAWRPCPPACQLAPTSSWGHKTRLASLSPLPACHSCLLFRIPGGSSRHA